MEKNIAPARNLSRRRSRSKLSHVLSCCAVAAGLWSSPARAINYYWDTNGVAAGAGQTPSGTWDGTNALFNTDSTGGNGTTSGTFVSTLTSADTVTFVAGPTLTATGDTAQSGGNAYVVTVSGTQTAGGLITESFGAVTFNGGTISLGSSGITAFRNTSGTNATPVASAQAGNVIINSAIQLTAAQTWSTGQVGATPTLTVAGNTTGTGDLTISDSTSRTFLLSGNMTQTGNVTFSGANTVASMTGNLGNTGNVTVNFSSAGSNVAFSRAAGNSYTGTTSVTGGILNITNTSGSATGAGAVGLSSPGGTALPGIITGTGISTGTLTVTAGGQITPGAVTTAGTITLGNTGGIALTAGTLNMNLSASATAGNDQIKTSTLTLGSALTVNLGAIGTAATVTNALATGVAYTLIDANGTAALNLSGVTITTNFATGAAGTTTAGFTGSYTATYSSNATGDLLVTFAAAPEPSTWAMLGLGVAGAGIAAARRRRAVA